VAPPWWQADDEGMEGRRDVTAAALADTQQPVGVRPVAGQQGRCGPKVRDGRPPPSAFDASGRQAEPANSRYVGRRPT